MHQGVVDLVPAALQHSTGFVRSGSAVRRWPTQDGCPVAQVALWEQIAEFAKLMKEKLEADRNELLPS